MPPTPNATWIYGCPATWWAKSPLIEEPVRIVGLVKELEYKAGALVPHRRRVLEMPRAVGDSPRALYRPRPVDHTPRVVGIRVEEGSRARRWRRILGAGLQPCC